MKEEYIPYAVSTGEWQCGKCDALIKEKASYCKNCNCDVEWDKSRTGVDFIKIVGNSFKFNTEFNGVQLKVFGIGTPQTTNFKNIRSMFTKQGWDLIRKNAYKESNYKCEICGEKGTDQGFKHPVECHEIWDWNFDTKQQILIGFISICPNCHKIIHCGLTTYLYETGKISSQSYESIWNHFKKVNGIESALPGHVIQDLLISSNSNFHIKKHEVSWEIIIDYGTMMLGKIIDKDFSLLPEDVNKYLSTDGKKLLGVES